MQVTASTFADPSLRAQLQQYYENKKAAAVEAWKARDNESLPKEVKIRGADGQYKTATLIPFSAEKMEIAFVSFDKWLEFQAESFDNRGFGPKRLEMAKQRMDALEEQSPDSSSNVRATFSSNGVLRAYINADGSLVTSNIGPKDGAPSPSPMERRLQAISQTANDMGLRGQARIDYLTREVKNALSQEYKDLNVTSYDSATSPTKREFGKMWYTNFDVDQHYNDAMADAKASFEDANAWYQQWQKNMNEIQSFLLSFQEAAPPA